MTPCWINRYLTIYPALSITILDIKAISDRSVRQLFLAKGPKHVVSRFVARFQSDGSFKVASILDCKDGVALGIAETRYCAGLCRTLADATVFLLHFRSLDDGLIECEVLADPSELKTPGLHIKEVRRPYLPRLLTTLQEKMLKMALEKGYFDYPKSVKQHELASCIGVKASTVSECLRRALKKLLQIYFDYDRSSKEGWITVVFKPSSLSEKADQAKDS